LQIRTKDIKIRIKSQISDLIISDAYNAAVTANMINNEINNIRHSKNKSERSDVIIDKFMNDTVNDRIEYFTCGKFIEEDDKYAVVYEESEIMGLEGCETSISYKKDSPGTIIMARTGSIVTGLVFDAEYKRHLCTYKTDFIPIEFFICIRKIENNLSYDNGGILFLDYDIEIRGARTERNRFFLEILNMKGDREQI